MTVWIAYDEAQAVLAVHASHEGARTSCETAYREREVDEYTPEFVWDVDVMYEMVPNEHYRTGYFVDEWTVLP